jgi:hypothetical protein
MLCVLGLLPAGDIETPNVCLQVEWFYKTFHKSDCAEYVRSGQKLHDETLQTLVKYFQLVHETRKNNGSLQRHQVEKICMEAKCELHHELEERYARKLRHLTNQRRSHRSHA